MGTGEIISITVSACVTIVTGIILWVLKSYIADLKKYREKRESEEKAKDELLLGLARCSLLENYYKCEKEGVYSLKDREVYGMLFKAYKTCGGDGVIDQLAPKLQALPTSTPAAKAPEAQR